jgi:YVTN family beta-propeller protein
MRLTTLLFTALGIALLHAQTIPPDALVVLSKGDTTLSVVDPKTLQVIGRVPSGPDPHEVIASADGKYAYISNYGGGAYNTITIVDIAALKALPAVDLGALRGPHGLVFAGGKVWFTAETAKAIGSYDPATKQVDFILGTGQNRTHMIAVSDDLARIVTTNVNSATVSIIERVVGGNRGRGAGAGPAPGGGAPGGAAGSAAGPPPRPDWNQTVVPVGNGAEGFDVSPDGKEIWAANAQDGTVSVVDVATKKVVQTLPANVTGANRLKFTPDGSRVVVSTLRGPEVVVLDAAARREVKRISVGRGAAGIQMQPDGARVYVACTPDNNVAVIDLKSLEVVGRIDAGRQPDGLAWVTRR